MIFYLIVQTKKKQEKKLNCKLATQYGIISAKFCTTISHFKYFILPILCYTFYHIS